MFHDSKVPQLAGYFKGEIPTDTSELLNVEPPRVVEYLNPVVAFSHLRLRQ